MVVTNRERLLELLHGREEMIPLIHDILAEHYISDTAYAEVFRLVFYTMSMGQDEEIAYCAGTKTWRAGKEVLSDVRLFCYLAQVCDIVVRYVRSSWEECIFSAWSIGVNSKEVQKAEADMVEMESLGHLRAILKIAATSMIFSSDGTIDWSAEAEDGPGSPD